jgi:hypothetical protein
MPTVFYTLPIFMVHSRKPLSHLLCVLRKVAVSMKSPSHLILGCILMATALFTSASAQTLSIPTSVRNLNEDRGAEFRPGELGKADRSILQITIGVHTLDDVLRILGPSQVMRSSEGCSEVCYISSIPGDGTRLIFGFDPLEGSRREGSRRRKGTPVNY